MPGSFNTVCNLKSKNAVGIDGVSAEVLRTFSVLTEFFNVFLPRGWFSKCLMNAKTLFLHEFGDTMKIENYKSISLLSAICKVLEKSSMNEYAHFLIKQLCFFSK